SDLCNKANSTAKAATAAIAPPPIFQNGFTQAGAFIRSKKARGSEITDMFSLFSPIKNGRQNQSTHPLPPRGFHGRCECSGPSTTARREAFPGLPPAGLRRPVPRGHRGDS